MEADGQGRRGQNRGSSIPRIAAALFPEGVVADELCQVTACIQDSEDCNRRCNQSFQ